MNHAAKIFALFVFFVLWAYPVVGQEIRIRVVNARSGKAINNECVNVSLGPWHGADLLAPTNSDGVVVLHFRNNYVTAEAASPRDCNGLAVLGPKPVPNVVDSLAITTDEYFDCQEWAKIVPGEFPKENLNRAPSYRIEKIVKSGVAAGNRCGKFRVEAKPGELVFFVRPLTWWERMRR